MIRAVQCDKPLDKRTELRAGLIPRLRFGPASGLPGHPDWARSVMPHDSEITR